MNIILLSYLLHMTFWSPSLEEMMKMDPRVFVFRRSAPCDPFSSNENRPMDYTICLN